MQTKPSRALASVLFFSGIFLGLLLAGAAIWSEIEAVNYFFSGATYDLFNGLQCPILMARTETGSVTAVFSNPGSQVLEPYYQVEISGALPRKFENQISIPSHQTKSIRWTVDASDIDLNPFIFVKLDVLPTAGYSTREATCGILVINIPGLTGSRLFWLAFAASLLGMVIGLGLWENAKVRPTEKSLNLKRAMQALAISVLLAMFTGFIGGWLPGTILCAVAILLLAILLRLAVS